MMKLDRSLPRCISMVKKFSDEEVMEWIKKSCKEQGKPIYIDNPSVISPISTILQSGSEIYLKVG